MVLFPVLVCWRWGVWEAGRSGGHGGKVTVSAKKHGIEMSVSMCSIKVLVVPEQACATNRKNNEGRKVRDLGGHG